MPLDILQGPGQLSMTIILSKISGGLRLRKPVFGQYLVLSISPLGLRSIERIGPFILCQEIGPQETQCSRQGNVYFQL